MANFKNSKDTLQILLVATATTFFFNAEGLKSWAASISLGTSHKVATSVSGFIYSIFDPIGLNFPRKQIRNGFAFLRKNYLSIQPTSLLANQSDQRLNSPSSS